MKLIFNNKILRLLCQRFISTPLACLTKCDAASRAYSLASSNSRQRVYPLTPFLLTYYVANLMSEK